MGLSLARQFLKRLFISFKLFKSLSLKALRVRKMVILVFARVFGGAQNPILIHF